LAAGNLEYQTPGFNTKENRQHRFLERIVHDYVPICVSANRRKHEQFELLAIDRAEH
jgi:hypothetical protein